LSDQNGIGGGTAIRNRPSHFT